jgi:hypothetical protein
VSTHVCVPFKDCGGTHTHISHTHTFPLPLLRSFAGHFHYYQRYAPLFPSASGSSLSVDSACLSADNHTYTDPKFTTMIVSGAPGDVERNDACPGDPTHAYVTTACSSGYGYGRFAIHNSTYLRWDFVALETPIGVEARKAGAAAPVTYTDWVAISRSAPPA